VLQVEFVAEDEIVEIVPNIRMDALNMICVRLPPPPTSIVPSLSTPHPPPILTSRAAAVAAVQGDFGPFFPQIPTKVPLWLAVALKKRSKCTIRTPDWMTVGQCFLPPFYSCSSIHSHKHLLLAFVPTRPLDTGIGSGKRVASRIPAITIPLY
jgi:hypothetical protein